MGIMADLLMADGVRQQDLAIAAIKDKATIARGLHTLEQEGLVTRVNDAEDRRNKLIYLTEKGRRLHAHVYPVLQENLSIVTTQVDTDELNNCLTTLDKIYGILMERLNEPKKEKEALGNE